MRRRRAGVYRDKVETSDRAIAYAAVIRGASRGFGALLVGGLVEPAAVRFLGPIGSVWLLLVALVAFVIAAVTATPSGTPLSSWRQGPIAAVAGYALIVPLVVAGSGSLPALQLGLTTMTAVVVGAVTAVVRTVRDHGAENSVAAGVREVR